MSDWLFSSDLILSLPTKLPMVIFEVFCYAAINDILGISMDGAELLGQGLLSLGCVLTTLP